MAAKLTPKQERFVSEYLVDLNATQAAIRAGYSAKYADRQAHKLVENSRVSEALRSAMEAQQKRIEITADRVLQEIARIAFFDPRKLFDRYGNPKCITDIDDDTAAAIAGLDVDTKSDGESDLLTITKRYKISDKQKSLDMLARHLGLLDGKRSDEVGANGGGGIIILPDATDIDDYE